MAHTRLSIIGLDERGTEPMENDTHVLIYNGEIYNFNEIADRLRADGIILREAAIIDRSKLGFDLEFFVYLKFNAQGRPNVKEFRRKIIEHDRVIGAYIILGNFDLMLHVVARDIRDYQQFYLEHLSGSPDLGDINSMTVMATLKEGQIPV